MWDLCMGNPYEWQSWPVENDSRRRSYRLVQLCSSLLPADVLLRFDARAARGPRREVPSGPGKVVHVWLAQGYSVVLTANRSRDETTITSTICKSLGNEKN